MKRMIFEPSGAVVVEERLDPTDDEGSIAGQSLRQKIGAYVALTKPRIIELLLITTVPSMIVAEGGMPALGLIVLTLVGGMLGAGGANAINCYIDRDIDEVMARTRRRPLPQHRVRPRNALIFGVMLGAFSFLLLWASVNLLAAAITLAALLFYVFVYTLGMKRSTPQNIVIGGAAGAAPALVGWAAVTGSIELPALALFGIIFYWTPPHFWALSLRYEKEYRAARVPMMPVVYGREETAKHILLYSFLLFALCLAFYSVAQMGVLFLVALVVLNAIFIWYGIRLFRSPKPRIAWSLFRYSIYYLGLLFTAAAVDVLLR